MKLYIKRNPNELAELAFREDYLNNVIAIRNFMFRYYKITRGLGKLTTINWRLARSKKFYLGDCNRDQFAEIMECYTDGNNIDVNSFLEIKE